MSFQVLKSKHFYLWRRKPGPIVATTDLYTSYFEKLFENDVLPFRVSWKPKECQVWLCALPCTVRGRAKIRHAAVEVSCANLFFCCVQFAFASLAYISTFRISVTTYKYAWKSLSKYMYLKKKIRKRQHTLQADRRFKLSRVSFVHIYVPPYEWSDWLNRHSLSRTEKLLVSLVIFFLLRQNENVKDSLQFCAAATSWLTGKHPDSLVTNRNPLFLNATKTNEHYPPSFKKEMRDNLCGYE